MKGKTKLIPAISLILLLVLLSGTIMAFEFESGLQYDFGGQTIVIVKDREGSLPEPGTEFYDRWHAVEDFFNCKLEMIWTGQHNVDDAVQMMMAGDPVDIVRFEGSPMLTLIALKLLRPLEDVWNDEVIDALDLPDFVKYEYKIGNTLGSYGGHIYATQAYDRTDGPYGAGLTFFWNKSMFEREGIESLYDIIERGEWTWEKLHEIARLLTKDTTGDGVVDQFGTGKRLTLRNGYNLIAVNGGALTRNIDGKVVCTLDEPQAVEAANFIRQLVEEGLTTWSKEDAKGDEIEFAEGNIGLNFHSGADYYRGVEWWYSNMEDEWGVAPWPVGPSTPDPSAYPALPTSDAFLVGIPISARYGTEELLAVFRALYPRDPYTYYDMYDRYEVLARSERELEAIEEYYLDVQGDPEHIGNATRHWFRMPGFNWESATRGLIDYQTHINEIMPSLQAQLDDMFN